VTGRQGSEERTALYSSCLKTRFLKLKQTRHIIITIIVDVVVKRTH